MKLNKNYIKYTVNGEAVLVPIDGAPFHGLVQGNKSVGVILDCLDRGTTEEEIIDALCSRFIGDREIIAADVADILTQLKSIGAIDE